MWFQNFRDFPLSLKYFDHDCRKSQVCFWRKKKFGLVFDYLGWVCFRIVAVLWARVSEMYTATRIQGWNTLLILVKSNIIVSDIILKQQQNIT